MNMREIENTLVYRLCQSTYYANVMDSAIIGINRSLEQIALDGYESATLRFIDLEDKALVSLQYTCIVVNTHDIPLPVLTIREFIIDYYRKQQLNPTNVEKDVSVSDSDICLDWGYFKNNYIDMITKEKHDNLQLKTSLDSTQQASVDHICDTIKVFMDDAEKDIITLRIVCVGVESLPGSYDMDGSASKGEFKVIIINKDQCIAEEIINYFDNSDQYTINLNVNNTDEDCTVSYTLEKTALASDNVKIRSDICVDITDEEIENECNKLPYDDIANFLANNLSASKPNSKVAILTYKKNFYYTSYNNKDLLLYTVEAMTDPEAVAAWISGYFGDDDSDYLFKLSTITYDYNSKPGYVVYEVTLK